MTLFKSCVVHHFAVLFTVEMPNLSPRSDGDDRDLAAKPTTMSDSDQRYLVMEKTALQSRSNYAPQTRPNQATRASSPNGPSPRKSETQISSPDMITAHCRHRDPQSTTRPHHFFGTSDPLSRSSPQSIPIGHALGNGLVPPIFRPPSRDHLQRALQASPAATPV